MDQIIEFAGNNFMLAGIWLALVGMLVYSYVSGLISPVKEVSVHEMTLLINREDAVVLDTRSANDYKAGHVTGARQIKPEELRERNFSKLEKHKDTPITSTKAGTAVVLVAPKVWRGCEHAPARSLAHSILIEP